MSETFRGERADGHPGVISRAEHLLAAREGFPLDRAGQVLRDDAAEFGIPLGVYAADVVDVFAEDDRIPG